MPSPASTVYVICEETTAGQTNLVEAHTTKKGAQAAMEKLSLVTQVKGIALKKATKEGDAEDTKPKMSKRAADQDEGEPEIKPKDVDWEENAMPNSLQGLKLLFTGRMDKTRKQLDAIATKYGASIAGKVEDADFVVLGEKPGDAKLVEIEQKGTACIGQAGFRYMLETGEAPRPAKKQKQ